MTPGRSSGTAPKASGRAAGARLVSRFNAWFFTTFAGLLDHCARSHKAGAFAGIAGGTVVELGAGTGANLHHLAPGTHLVAVEPSSAMHQRLRRRAADAGVVLTLVPTGAEHLPLDDASVDEVICSLVLCTVADPAAVLAEVRRVLRPGGRFRFVEHVAAARGIRALVQRRIRRPWAWLFEGCDPHRHTARAISDAGFDRVELHHRKFRHSVFWPVNTALWGIATR
jgi:ubiquinone/menaquinone biosynthesis C-methylase UbiE